MPKKQSTYAGLGALMDAVTAEAEVSKKKGKPLDMIPTASELAPIQVGTAMMGLPSLMNTAQQYVNDYISGSFSDTTYSDKIWGAVTPGDSASGIGPSINLGGILYDPKTTSTGIVGPDGKLSDASLSYDPKGVRVPIGPGTVIDVLTGKEGAAIDKVADKYAGKFREMRKAQQAISAAKIIGGIGTAPQRLALAFGAGSIVDGDVKAFTANIAEQGTLFSKVKSRENTYAQALGMVGGLINEDERSTAVREIQKYMAKKNVDISRVFGGKLADSQAQLADIVANSVTNAGARDSIVNYITKSKNADNGFEAFYKAARTGNDLRGRGEGGMGSIAATRLAMAYSDAGYRQKAEATSKFADLVSKVDGKMTLGERYLYTSKRWNDFKSGLPGVVSFTGFMRGDFFKFMAENGGMYGVANTGDFKKGFLDAVAASKGGANNMDAFGKDKLGTVNKFFISKDANGMQKLFYGLHTFHPVQIIQGAFNGALFERMYWMGSKQGRIKDYNKLSWMGKFGFNMMNNKGMQAIFRVNRGIHNVLKAPGRIANVIATAPIKFMEKVMNKLLSKLMAKLAEFIGKRVLDALTAGLGLVLDVLGAAYNVVNILTLGLLDNVVMGAIKLILQFTAVLIIGSCILVMFCCGAAGGGFAGLNSANEYAPDPSYSPLGYALPDLGTYKSDVTNPIDPKDYNQFLTGNCPFPKPFTCTQGPYGAFSHACMKDTNGNLVPGTQKAVDVVPVPGTVYAPEDGSISKTGDYKCTSSIKPADSIGNFVEFKGKSGTVYGFYHTTPATTTGAQVKKGTLIGVMSIAVPYSACWTGAHIHAYVNEDGRNIDAREVYVRMCGDFTCQGNSDTNNCGAR